MGTYTIKGGKRLKGELCVEGAKNAILPVLAACLLCSDEIVLENCPVLSDVDNTIAMMRAMGCQLNIEGDCITVNASGLSTCELPLEYSKKMRSSIFMLGPLISRQKCATAYFPGGCEIGLRPIDLHLKALSDLNVEIREECGKIFCNGENMSPGNVVLDYPSVGATENILMSAVFLDGTTTIHNSAREPEIVDLQNFLNSLGAKVSGAGTGTITVQGVKKLHGGKYRIMGDRIVAGTFLTAAAITRGDVTVSGIEPAILHSVLAKLKECGCSIRIYDRCIRLKAEKQPGEISSVITAPFPGFPTDMQAQMFALCCVCKGTSIITENVFENRFKHSNELVKMGANVIIKDRMAIIKGVQGLKGAEVDAMDLRGGAALILAGLNAEGVTKVNNSFHVKRGYENFAQKLRAIGGDITED